MPEASIRRSMSRRISRARSVMRKLKPSGSTRGAMGPSISHNKQYLSSYSGWSRVRCQVLRQLTRRAYMSATSSIFDIGSPMTGANISLPDHPLTAWKGPLGLPDFTSIRQEDFGPVFRAALTAHEAEIAAIANNPDAPTIENTLAAMEVAGKPLSCVSAIFWCLAGANTNPDIQKLEREISPLMARHSTRIYMNPALFA